MSEPETRSAELDTVRARNALFRAWLDLERACGVPLLQFPDAPGADAVPAPQPDDTIDAEKEGE